MNFDKHDASQSGCWSVLDQKPGPATYIHDKAHDKANIAFPGQYHRDYYLSHRLQSLKMVKYGIKRWYKTVEGVP